MFEPFEPAPRDRKPPFAGTVRPAHVSDAAVMGPLTLQDVQVMATLSSDRQGTPLEKSLRARKKELSDPEYGTKRLLFVAEEDETVIGFGRVCYVPEFEEVDPPLRPPVGWYLLGVVVAPEHRRRGVASALTRTRLAWLAERASEAFYFTRNTNATSIALHEAFGFEELTTEFLFPRTGLEPANGTMFRLAL